MGRCFVIAVRAYYMLVTHNPIPGAYYNIGGTFTLSVKGMLEKLISLSSKSELIQTENRI